MLAEENVSIHAGIAAKAKDYLKSTAYESAFVCLYLQSFFTSFRSPYLDLCVPIVNLSVFVSTRARNGR